MELGAGQPGHRRKRGVLLLCVLTASGLLATGLTVGSLSSAEQDDATRSMDQRTDVVATAIGTEVGRYVDTAEDLAVAVGAQSHLSAADFASMTSTLDRDRLPGISGVALVVPGVDSEVPRLQEEWRARGADGLVLEPHGAGGEHLFTVLNRTFDGSTATLGRDLSQATEPRDALRLARAGDRVQASVTYVLLRDRDLPVDEQQLSFVLAAPVHAGAGTSDAGRFRGWVLLGMRGEDFLSGTLEDVAQDTMAVELFDGPEPSATVPVAGFAGAPLLEDERLERGVEVDVASRTWQLQVRPTTGFTRLVGQSRTEEAATGGILITLLLVLLVGTLVTSRNRALVQVDDATAALRADIERRERVEAELRVIQAELHSMALTDPLTGLANRRAFMDQLDQAHARAARHGTRLAVLFGDVDHFKSVNDTYGHAAGDAVLRELARRLRAHFRAEDTVGRLGGDEFAIICENYVPHADSMTDRLQAALASPYDHQGTSITATVSIGLACPETGESSSALLERADTVMYTAKAGSRA